VTQADGLPRSILIPLANPRTAADLVRIGTALLAEGGILTALSIVEVPEGVALSEGATRARQARRLLQRVLEFVPEGVELRTVVRIGRRADEGIVELAAEEEADLILFGWGGPGGHRPVTAGGTSGQRPAASGSGGSASARSTASSQATWRVPSSSSASTNRSSPSTTRATRRSTTCSQRNATSTVAAEPGGVCTSVSQRIAHRSSAWPAACQVRGWMPPNVHRFRFLSALRRYGQRT